LNLDQETVTVVGEIGHDVDCLVYSTDGQLYGINQWQRVLVSIDPETGAGSIIGPTGVDAWEGFGPDLAEDDLGRLWLMADSKLITINRQTGAATLECELEHSYSSGLAFWRGQGFTTADVPPNQNPDPGCGLRFFEYYARSMESGPGGDLFRTYPSSHPSFGGTIVGTYDPWTGNYQQIGFFNGHYLGGLAFPPADQQQPGAPIPTIDWRGVLVMVFLLAAAGLYLL